MPPLVRKCFYQILLASIMLEVFSCDPVSLWWISRRECHDSLTRARSRFRYNPASEAPPHT
jgi:hypothetical protein